jgi:hypothetical protein
MAFNQPLIPVLPVARELISKSKWMANKGTHMLDLRDHGKNHKDNAKNDPNGPRSQVPGRRRVISAPKPTQTTDENPISIASTSSVAADLDPRDIDELGYPLEGPQGRNRTRILGIFRRVPSKSRRSLDSSKGVRSFNYILQPITAELVPRPRPLRASIAIPLRVIPAHHLRGPKINDDPQ